MSNLLNLAHSFSTALSPPLVASRIVCGFIPALNSFKATSFRLLQSLFRSSPSSNSSLAASTTPPCLPTSPEMRIFAPAFKFLSSTPSQTISPIPAVFMKILSHLPFGTTFVSPQTTLTPLSLQVFASEPSTFSSSSILSPSSMMSEQLRYFALAPTIARSFIVPQAAILPMSPPLKKIGVTTKLSELNAIFPFKFSIAESLLCLKISLSKILNIVSFISEFISSPPPPWLSIIFFIKFLNQLLRI